MVYFATILAFAVLTFALLNEIAASHAGHGAPRTSHGSSSYSLSTFLHVLGTKYQQMHGANPAPASMHALQWGLYFCSTMLINIVSLNLLISVISNTYDRVQGAMDAFHCKTKASMLLELACFQDAAEEEEEEL